MKRKLCSSLFSLALLLALIASMSGSAGLATSLTLEPQASPLGTGFTYQGQLKDGGTPVDGTCDFQFSLWDALSGGSQIGSTLDRTADVAGGLFTVQLDFGSGAFTGDSRWLEIAVRCPAGGRRVHPSRPAPAADRGAVCPVRQGRALVGAERGAGRLCRRDRRRYHLQRRRRIGAGRHDLFRRHGLRAAPGERRLRGRQRHPRGERRRHGGLRAGGRRGGRHHRRLRRDGADRRRDERRRDPGAGYGLRRWAVRE